MGQELSRSVSGGKMESSSVTAVGVWFYSINTGRYLYLMRNDSKHPGSWGLPGGRIEESETIIQAITRECEEELGSMPGYLKLVPLEKFTTPDNVFAYHTFFCSVSTEFTPVLNHEHCGYAWVGENQYPKPLHPGLFNTVNFDIVIGKLSALTNKKRP